MTRFMTSGALHDLGGAPGRIPRDPHLNDLPEAMWESWSYRTTLGCPDDWGGRAGRHGNAGR